MNEQAGQGDAATLLDAVGQRHPSTVHIIRFFAWSHLPERLAAVSHPIGVLALDLVHRLPDGPELTAGLRKLLEAKDCLVRAALEGDDTR